MKYIDADKLKAEIERLKEETPIGICEYDKGEENGRMEVLISLQSTIDSLQQEQPAVDLEKEYKAWWNSITGKINIEHTMEWYMHETARHFYKLGLNAGKGGKA